MKNYYKTTIAILVLLVLVAGCRKTPATDLPNPEAFSEISSSAIKTTQTGEEKPMTSSTKNNEQNTTVVSTSIPVTSKNEHGVMVEYHKYHNFKTDEEKLERYRKMETFEYKIQDAYSSREEIEQASHDLDECYYAYLYSEGVTEEEKEEIAKTYRKIKERLEKMLKKFPKSEEEKLQERVNTFFSRVGFKETAVHGWRSSYYQERNEHNRLGYEKALAIWEEAERIQKDYEEARISFDEAERRLFALSE